MRAASDLETENFSTRSRTSARKLAVLGYHKIGEPPRWLADGVVYVVELLPKRAR
jgi:hypothetical protein